MPSREESARAGVADISDYGEKDVEGAYPPGTMLDLGDGRPIDLSKVPDVIGGRAKPAPARRKGGRSK